MDSLSLLTINTNGCRKTEKLFKLFEYLKLQSADIYFLQETHTLCTDESCWYGTWRGRILFSYYQSNSCGVAIMMRQNINFSVIFTKTVIAGRCLHITVKIQNSVYE